MDIFGYNKQKNNIRSANFPKNKKVGNSHSKLLAYRSSSYIETMRNSKVDLSQFLIKQKTPRYGEFLALF